MKYFLSVDSYIKNNKIIVTNVPNKMGNPRRNNNKNAMSLIVEFFMTI